MRYVTKRKNYFMNHVWLEGEILNFTGEVVPCPVCEGTGKVKGAICMKCAGTKRSIPPHHFMPEKSVNVEEKQAEAKKELTEKEAIMAEMDEMGKAYDKRWSLKKMQEALIVAKKETGK